MVYNKYFTVDSHCHVYPQKIAARAVAGTDNFYDEHSVGSGTVDNLLELGESAGIDRFIIQSVATTPKQVTSINEFIAQTAENSGGRMTGLGTLHPGSADIAGDIRRITELKLHGVKLHPDIQQFKIDDYRCLKIYELCERERLPILMHTGDNRYDYSNPNRLLPILEAYAGLTVIGAHFGGWSIWEQAAEQLAGIPNFYVDCSSSLPYLSKTAARGIIGKYTPQHVLFGTDYPMWSPEKELESFLSLELSDSENRMILSENACRIYNIKL